MKYIRFSLSFSFSAADSVIFKTSTYNWVGHHRRNMINKQHHFITQAYTPESTVETAPSPQDPPSPRVPGRTGHTSQLPLGSYAM